MARVEFPAEQARIRWGDLLDLAYAKGARVTITYRGKPRAVLVGYEDMQRLEELERAARRRGRSSAD